MGTDRRAVTREAVIAGQIARRPWQPVLLAATAFLSGVVRVAVIVSEGGPWFSPRPSTSILAPHLLAEFLMATLPAIGAIAWWRRLQWGPGLLVFGLGASLYASLNAMGWALVNLPATLLPIYYNLINSECRHISSPNPFHQLFLYLN